MQKPIFLMPNERAPFAGNIPSGLDSQLSLLPMRISTVFPIQPTAKHISFVGTAEDGSVYYCKSDVDERPIRATEWIAQSLSLHLGIAVPEFRVIERNDETFFGSRQAVSTAGVFEVGDFLARKQFDELGGASDWLGRRLSGLYVLDVFLNNPDRGSNNFVLEKDGYTNKLCAIDFADVRLDDITSDRFPIAGSNTIVKARHLRSVHGFYLDAALEMIERIRAVPTSEMNDILARMPSDWMSDDQKSQFLRVWADGHIEGRLSALRAGLKDGSRL